MECRVQFLKFIIKSANNSPRHYGSNLDNISRIMETFSRFYSLNFNLMITSLLKTLGIVSSLNWSNLSTLIADLHFYKSLDANPSFAILIIDSIDSGGYHDWRIAVFLRIPVRRLLQQNINCHLFIFMHTIVKISSFGSSEVNISNNVSFINMLHFVMCKMLISLKI